MYENRRDRKVGKAVKWLERGFVENVGMDCMADFYQGKKVLITGNTGFKGCWLSEILLFWGAEPIGYALRPTVEPNLFSINNLKSRMVCYFEEICSSRSLQQVLEHHQPEIIFHLAAQPLVSEGYNNPILTYETNVMGTIHLMEAARYCSSAKSIIIVTTDKVYNNREWLWGYRENEELGGVDPYSTSKACADLTAQSYRSAFFSKTDQAVSIVRAGNVIGGGDFALNRIVPDCYKSITSGIPVVLRHPHSVRPYQHVLDCLMGYLMIGAYQFNSKEKYEGEYNFGPSEEDCVTTKQLVELLAQKLRTLSGQVRFCYTEQEKKTAFHEANVLKLDSTKAKCILGWKPRWTIAETVNKTAEWYAVYLKNGDIQACIKNQIEEYLRDGGC